ncbi:hypothetical protein Tco_1371487 [Tanacetum coccineum]
MKTKRKLAPKSVVSVGHGEMFGNIKDSLPLVGVVGHSKRRCVRCLGADGWCNMDVDALKRNHLDELRTAGPSQSIHDRRILEVSFNMNANVPYQGGQCLTMNTNAGISGQQILADDVGSSKRRRIDQMNIAGPSLPMHDRPVLEVFSDVNANVPDLQVPAGAQHLRTNGSVSLSNSDPESPVHLLDAQTTTRGVAGSDNRVPPSGVPALDRHFMENIRAYNQMFSMTSLGAHIDDSVNNGRGTYVFKISGQLYHWTAREKLADTHIPNFKVRLYNVVGAREYALPTGDMLAAIVYELGHETDIGLCHCIGRRSGLPSSWRLTYEGHIMRMSFYDSANCFNLLVLKREVQFLSESNDAIYGCYDGSDCVGEVDTPTVFSLRGSDVPWLTSKQIEPTLWFESSIMINFSSVLNTYGMNSHLAESSQINDYVLGSVSVLMLHGPCGMAYPSAA